MPGMDGTGPAGQGPMTGRGLGPCGSQANNTGQPANVFGRFFRGALGGFGFGWRGGLQGRRSGMGGGRRRGGHGGPL